MSAPSGVELTAKVVDSAVAVGDAGSTPVCVGAAALAGVDSWSVSAEEEIAFRGLCSKSFTIASQASFTEFPRLRRLAQSAALRFSVLC